jgi:hypothetical protein
MWISLIMFVLTYLTTKRAGGSDTAALMTAGLAGAGTYYATTSTDWGKANLQPLEDKITGAATPVLDSKGQPVIGKDGTPLVSTATGLFDVFKEWGATGTAAVIGTAGVVTGSIPKSVIYLGIGLGAVFLLSR